MTKTSTSTDRSLRDALLGEECPRDAEGTPLGTVLAACYHASPLTTPVEAAAFWAAVVLPFVSLGLLAADASAGVVLAVVALDALAVVAGHTYR